MGTRRGVVKKTDLSAYSNPRAGGIIAMGVEEMDAVIAVAQTDGRAQVFIATRDGMSIQRSRRIVRERASPAGTSSRCS